MCVGMNLAKVATISTAAPEPAVQPHGSGPQRRSTEGNTNHNSSGDAVLVGLGAYKTSKAVVDDSPIYPGQYVKVGSRGCTSSKRAAVIRANASRTILNLASAQHELAIRAQGNEWQMKHGSRAGGDQRHAYVVFDWQDSPAHIDAEVDNGEPLAVVVRAEGSSVQAWGIGGRQLGGCETTIDSKLGVAGDSGSNAQRQEGEDRSQEGPL